MEAYGISEKSVAKKRFDPNPIPNIRTAASSGELEKPKRSVKKNNRSIELAMVLRLPKTLSASPPRYDPTTVATPNRATIPPAAEFVMANLLVRKSAAQANDPKVTATEAKLGNISANMFFVNNPLGIIFGRNPEAGPERDDPAHLTGSMIRNERAREYKTVTMSGGLQFTPTISRGSIEEATSCPTPFAEPKSPIARPNSFRGNECDRSLTIEGKTTPPEAPAITLDANIQPTEFP